MSVPTLRILVGVKRVVDYAVKVRVKPDHSAVETANLKTSMNPFCELAVEAAVQLRERLGAERVAEVVAASIGPAANQETLRTALAMGADRAVLVSTDNASAAANSPSLESEPLGVARALAAMQSRLNANLIILGKQAIDDDANQTGQLLAGILNWSQATFLSKIEFEEQSDWLQVDREVDEGIERLRLRLPCVLTCDLRLNQPRYVTLPNLMRAKTKPIETRTPSELGVTLNPHWMITRVDEPPSRRQVTMLRNVDELVAKLRQLGVLNRS
ncbi:hypothetical protein F1559_002580 [Cyanidiococcus yangmingshanensis]|uniref:Electron transfer flavoprotein subunit beta n=1 Tax=Cyanidiococcus yangmingshanensis TaxID=2690220 RepID=A0A7J7IL91_9RHOD|nr:hypothetical protein F1559_002580 [Cyanidiococcus yangmingshanensis]